MIDTIMVVIDYGDYFINALLSFFSMNLTHLSAFLTGHYVLRFETFSGLVSSFSMPQLGIFSDILKFGITIISEFLFFPSRLIGWFTGIEMNVLLGFMSLILWYPILIGIMKLVALVGDIVDGLDPFKGWFD